MGSRCSGGGPMMSEPEVGPLDVARAALDRIGAQAIGTAGRTSVGELVDPDGPAFAAADVGTVDAYLAAADRLRTVVREVLAGWTAAEGIAAESLTDLTGRWVHDLARLADALGLDDE
jgi:hypothetical protein